MYIGIVLSGVFSILFGLIPNLALMCICRFVQGLGSAATWSATYSLLAEFYPFRSTHVIGLTETATGVGGMAGPSIFAFLSNSMGFAFPFIVIGVLLLSQLPVLPIALSRMHKRLESTLQLQSSQSNLSLLSSSSALSSSSSSASSSASLSRRDYCMQMLNATLVVCGLSVLMTEMVSLGLTPFYEEHLSGHFDLGGNSIGLVLTCSSVSYALLAPAVGWLSHKLGSMRVMIVGMLLIGVSTSLMGPPPFLVSTTAGSRGLQLALLVLAFVVNGVGTALAFVPTLPEMMNSVAHLGPEATGIVSGSFYAIFSVGGAVGPFVGEAIMAEFGFPWSAVIFGVAMIVFAPFVLLGRFDISSAPDDVNNKRARRQARRRRRQNRAILIDVLSPSSSSSSPSSSSASASSTSSPLSSSPRLSSSTVSTPRLASERRLPTAAVAHYRHVQHGQQHGHDDTDDESDHYDDDEGDYDDEDSDNREGEEALSERAWEADEDSAESAEPAEPVEAADSALLQDRNRSCSVSISICDAAN